MQWFIDLILRTGESVVNLMLYNFLPIMVTMSGIMALLDYFGVLKWIQKVLTPIFSKIGIPGIGVIGLIQLNLIGFAAPIPTIGIIEKDKGISSRAVAATMAMLFAVGQANVTFPLSAYGLDFGVTMLGSIFGGIVAALTTFFIFGRRLSTKEDNAKVTDIINSNRPSSPLDAMNEGGMVGMQMVVKAFPMFLFALIIVNILRDAGVVDALNTLLFPLIGESGSPFLLAIFSKYLAGGTAMMGITMDMLANNQISPNQFNMMSGFLINSLDIVGVAVYVSVGPRLKKVLKPAISGAVIGIIFSGIFHILWFS